MFGSVYEVNYRVDREEGVFGFPLILALSVCDVAMAAGSPVWHFVWYCVRRGYCTAALYVGGIETGRLVGDGKFGYITRMRG